MDNPVENYWSLRMQEMQEQLKANNFETYVVENGAEASKLILEDILPVAAPKTVSYGGSITVKGTGVLDEIENLAGIELLKSDAAGLSFEEKIEVRRQALLVDLYFTGTNAVTEDGQLVNLDMIGNRVAALTFGPKKVVVLIGRNKIVPDLETAMYRIKDFSAPVNTMRLDMKTPCVKTSTCVDCNSPARICNSWTITEKSFPKNRVAVILINEDLGL